ncbi:GLT18-like protein [Mya arenaria]|uniref:GLT18-like protein n=1 Tax=Mya arenaria TaxID=6604 RepID=A0ABY7G069_MYAAR|nr:GLT18-like protein [Mya arenaria]
MDIRPADCQKIEYPDDLPQIGVVIIFRDEWPSILLRTVYSVLQMTPEILLKEIILVDDGSKDIELRLKVAIHAKALEKVRIVRHETSRGLMMARQSGIAAVTARGVVCRSVFRQCKVVVFHSVFRQYRVVACHSVFHRCKVVVCHSVFRQYKVVACHSVFRQYKVVACHSVFRQYRVVACHSVFRQYKVVACHSVFRQYKVVVCHSEFHQYKVVACHSVFRPYKVVACHSVFRQYKFRHLNHQPSLDVGPFCEKG